MFPLDSDMREPAPLENENININEIKDQIPDWICYHLKTTVEADVHYENQLYGQWNIFLSSVFPLRRQYMVIPQALIRRAMEAVEIHEDLANVSFGSTGAFHESRTLDGPESEKQYPDFLTVKVTPSPGPVRQHHAICVVEIKRTGESMLKSGEQMMQYLYQLVGHPSKEDKMKGFLVVGSTVRTFTLTERHGIWTASYNPGHDYDLFKPHDRGDPFTTALCELARQTWNA